MVDPEHAPSPDIRPCHCSASRGFATQQCPRPPRPGPGSPPIRGLSPGGPSLPSVRGPWPGSSSAGGPGSEGRQALRVTLPPSGLRARLSLCPVAPHVIFTAPNVHVASVDGAAGMAGFPRVWDGRGPRACTASPVLPAGTKLSAVEFGNLQKLDGPTEQCQDPAPEPLGNCSISSVSPTWPGRAGLGSLAGVRGPGTQAPSLDSGAHFAPGPLRGAAAG